MTQKVLPASAVPAINRVTLADLATALRFGWRDFTRAPLFGLFFASVYVLGGWVMYLALTVSGQLWWTLPAAAGFPILGPFIACGLYEVSRQIEQGRRPGWRSVLVRRKAAERILAAPGFVLSRATLNLLVPRGD